MSESMPIRFQCPSCSQPIEIDEQWANRQVICPYCRKTVTAPTESTLDESPPVATPLRTSPAPSQQPVPSGEPYWQVNPRKTYGHLLPVFAIGLTTLALLLMVIYSWLLFGQISDRIGPSPTEAEIQQVTLEMQNEIMQKITAGEIEGWFVVSSFSICLFFPCWVAGLVLSILSLRTGKYKRVSIFSLILSAMLGLVLLSPFFG